MESGAIFGGAVPSRGVCFKTAGDLTLVYCDELILFLQFISQPNPSQDRHDC
jgi:hypothetical protein